MNIRCLSRRAHVVFHTRPFPRSRSRSLNILSSRFLTANEWDEIIHAKIDKST